MTEVNFERDGVAVAPLFSYVAKVPTFYNKHVLETDIFFFYVRIILYFYQLLNW